MVTSLNEKVATFTRLIWFSKVSFVRWHAALLYTVVGCYFCFANEVVSNGWTIHLHAQTNLFQTSLRLGEILNACILQLFSSCSQLLELWNRICEGVLKDDCAVCMIIFQDEWGGGVRGNHVVLSTSMVVSTNEIVKYI